MRLWLLSIIIDNQWPVIGQSWLLRFYRDPLIYLIKYIYIYIIGDIKQRFVSVSEGHTKQLSVCLIQFAYKQTTCRHFHRESCPIWVFIFHQTMQKMLSSVAVCQAMTLSLILSCLSISKRLIEKFGQKQSRLTNNLPILTNNQKHNSNLNLNQNQNQKQKLKLKQKQKPKQIQNPTDKIHASMRNQAPTTPITTCNYNHNHNHNFNYHYSFNYNKYKEMANNKWTDQHMRHFQAFNHLYSSINSINQLSIQNCGLKFL